MTAPELVAILERLDLSQAGAARLSGYDKQTVHRACKGILAVPAPLAAILTLMERARISGDRAMKLLDG